MFLHKDMYIRVFLKATEKLENQVASLKEKSRKWKQLYVEAAVLTQASCIQVMVSICTLILNLLVTVPLLFRKSLPLVVAGTKTSRFPLKAYLILVQTFPCFYDSCIGLSCYAKY